MNLWTNLNFGILSFIPLNFHDSTSSKLYIQIKKSRQIIQFKRTNKALIIRKHVNWIYFIYLIKRVLFEAFLKILIQKIILPKMSRMSIFIRGWGKGNKDMVFDTERFSICPHPFPRVRHCTILNNNHVMKLSLWL